MYVCVFTYYPSLSFHAAAPAPAQFAATHVVGLCGLGSAFGHIVP